MKKSKENPYLTIPFLGYFHVGRDGAPEMDAAGNLHGTVQLRAPFLEGVDVGSTKGFGYDQSIEKVLRRLVLESGHLDPKVIAERARRKALK